MPPPQVEVGVVRLVPLREPFINLPFHLVDRVVNALFLGGKNKYTCKTLKTLFLPHGVNVKEALELTNELLSRCDVDPKTTAVGLSMADIKALCFGYKLLTETHPLLKERGQSMMESEVELDIDYESDSQSVVVKHEPPPKFVVQF